ncbi:MAG: aldolase/citrate lyase family protein [Candidatus Methanomethylicia archaeon]
MDYLTIMVNKLKEKLLRNEIAYGVWITMNCPDIVEALSMLDFDWMLIDMEHAPLTISDVQRLLQVIDEEKITPIVRVWWNDFVQIKLALDVGAMGIMIPWINNAKQAEEAVKAIRYPPRGIRGYGPRRAAKYGLKLKEYLERVDEDIILISQIETLEAVKNLDEIISVEGVDALFIGPYDLATSLGYLGNPQHSEVQKIISEILNKCLEKNKPIGIYSSLEMAEKHRDMGFKMIAIGSEINALISTFKNKLNELKGSSK